MNIFKIAFFLLLFTANGHTQLFAAGNEGAQDQLKSLNAENMALRAVLRLEQELGQLAAKSNIVQAADKKQESTQDKITKEHQRAKDNDYDKQFHSAIKENGGSRLKEEWSKNCRNRTMNPKNARGSADLAETNC